MYGVVSRLPKISSRSVYGAFQISTNWNRNCNLHLESSNFVSRSWRQIVEAKLGSRHFSTMFWNIFCVKIRWWVILDDTLTSVIIFKPGDVEFDSVKRESRNHLVDYLVLCMHGVDNLTVWDVIQYCVDVSYSDWVISGGGVGILI